MASQGWETLRGPHGHLRTSESNTLEKGRCTQSPAHPVPRPPLGTDRAVPAGRLWGRCSPGPPRPSDPLSHVHRRCNNRPPLQGRPACSLGPELGGLALALCPGALALDWLPARSHPRAFAASAGRLVSPPKVPVAYAAPRAPAHPRENVLSTGPRLRFERFVDTLGMVLRAPLPPPAHRLPFPQAHGSTCGRARAPW